MKFLKQINLKENKKPAKPEDVFTGYLSSEFTSAGKPTKSRTFEIYEKDKNAIFKELFTDPEKQVMTEDEITEFCKKVLSRYNAEILNKFQDQYLMDKGPRCEEMLYPVLEKAIADFINPPNDGMKRNWNLKSFIRSLLQATKAEAIQEYKEELIKKVQDIPMTSLIEFKDAVLTFITEEKQKWANGHSYSSPLSNSWEEEFEKIYKDCLPMQGVKSHVKSFIRKVEAQAKEQQTEVCASHYERTRQDTIKEIIDMVEKITKENPMYSRTWKAGFYVAKDDFKARLQALLKNNG